MSAITYEIIPSEPVTTQQQWEEASTKVLRRKKIKLIGSVVLTNIIGLGAIAWGAWMYVSANTALDECHIKVGCGYDAKNHSVHCNETNNCEGEEVLVEYMGGVASMAIGLVVEVASPLFTYFLDKGRRKLVQLNTPETILCVRDLLLNSPNPRYFANQYSSKIPDLVDLGIFPIGRLDEYHVLLRRYDALMNPSDEQEMASESTAENLEVDWEAFKGAIRSEIPCPITV